MIIYDKEKERKWLLNKKICIEELLAHLTALNDSVMVYVKKITIDSRNSYKLYEMSNGFSYYKSIDGFWIVV